MLGQGIGHPIEFAHLSRTAFSSGVAAPGGTITQGRGHLVTSSLHRRYIVVTGDVVKVAAYA